MKTQSVGFRRARSALPGICERFRGRPSPAERVCAFSERRGRIKLCDISCTLSSSRGYGSVGGRSRSAPQSRSPADQPTRFSPKTSGSLTFQSAPNTLLATALEAS
ncbi:unnamed protein product [Rangifer tarandus platyrhynchus]|uniref:Uncharacterized protein n=2 Tax=Rangifer tarandus platyrhynchus TaxID=3082113 RepID=A0ACB0F294_RANTA|nr:unnamed protein product [Rangifer tarandus platyrhynchus]CAI9707080.1 unnamed protein product [Rangifer tarandus platyrhynchus]